MCCNSVLLDLFALLLTPQEGKMLFWDIDVAFVQIWNANKSLACSITALFKH